MCRGGREEAGSIQLGQPYSEGIRYVIQPLLGRVWGGGAKPALTLARELKAAGPLVREANPWHKQTATIRNSSYEHIHIKEQLDMEELRKIPLQPTQARAGSIYFAIRSPPRELIRCRLACNVVFPKCQASFAQRSLQEDFIHRRWGNESSSLLSAHRPVYI